MVKSSTETGKPINGESKVAVGGGMLEFSENNAHYSDGNVLFESDAIDGVTTAISKTDNSAILTWGYEKPLSAYAKPFIAITSDLGRHWSKIQTNVPVSYAWLSAQFNQDNTIFIQTDKSILASTNKGSSWSQLFSSPQLITDSYIDGNSMAVVTEAKVYVSTDHGKKWTQIPFQPGTSVIRINSTGRTTILAQGQLYYWTGTAWKPIKIAIQNLSDFYIVHNRIVLYSASKHVLSIFDLKSSHLIYQSLSNMSVSAVFHDGNSLYFQSNNSIYKISSLDQNSNPIFMMNLNRKGGTTISGIVDNGTHLFIGEDPAYEWENLRRAKA